jgi:hypothetical protein
VSALPWFHVILHTRPTGAGALPGDEQSAPLPVGFEAAGASLSALPRMYCEADGAFVWVADDGSGWQLEGVLYDGGECLRYVELQGNCPARHFDQLLSCLGWPAAELVFQLPREGLVLDEADFRRRVWEPS